MRKGLYIAFFLLLNSLAFGQTREIDSLKNIVNYRKGDVKKEAAALQMLIERYMETNMDSLGKYAFMGISFLPKASDSASIDTNTVKILQELAGLYQFDRLDSAIILSTLALEYAQRLKFKRGEALASMTLGENYRLRGEYLKAIELLYAGLSISREIGDRYTEAGCLSFMGIANIKLGEPRRGLDNIFQAMTMVRRYFVPEARPFMMSNIGDAYGYLDMPDSARFYQESAKAITDSMKTASLPVVAQIKSSLGLLEARAGKSELAKRYYWESIGLQDSLTLGPAQFGLANLLYKLGNNDSSLYYARLAFAYCTKRTLNGDALDASRLLSKIFHDKGRLDSALFYQTIAMSLSDTMFSVRKFNNVQASVMKENERQKEVEQAKVKAANKTRTYALLSAVAVFLVVALILFRNNRQKQKANALLNQQKEEIARAMTELKNTQAQLIQSEKMASLGELTAGIAHEIQNPLNFVNNFSELNKELVVDMNLALEKNDYDQVKKIAIDLAANEMKIAEHGKRADGIVKGMLQHSRTSTGQKEPTDVNALCDEYLRLCYHGMRARNKSFNANLQTQFESTLPKINLVSQDLGRVLLNLFNNAFYATAQQASLEKGNSYEPTVMVSTKKLGSGVEIKITDNGTGIPKRIVDKIFQPFFTTKPTGQGTGLGLSMSYDIIKAHGGEIEVHSAEGHGSEFIVQLPVN